MVKSFSGGDTIPDILSNHASSLAQKANQTDLNTTNQNVSANTNAIGSLSQLNTSDKSSVVNALREIKAQANTNQTQIGALSNGAPAPVSLIANMTDHTKNYVYTGSETGYTAGHWYYWNGSAWTDGGIYQATSLPSNAGDQLVQIYNLCDSSKITTGSYLGASGSPVSANYSYSDYIAVTPGQIITFYGPWSLSYLGATYDTNKAFVNSLFSNSASMSGATGGFHYTVPSGVSYVRINMDNAQQNQLHSMVINGNVTYPSTYTAYGQMVLSNNLVQGMKNSLSLQQMNVDIPNQNVSLGQYNLSSSNPSKYNVAMGYGAMQNNYYDGTQDAGMYNVGIGFQAMQQNTTGNHNTAVGYNAMHANTTGTGNTAIGEDALLNETTGSGNTALGMRALESSTNAQNNTAIGVSAMYWDTSTNVTGSENTAIGHYAGSSVGSDTQCTFVGTFAGKDAAANSYSDSTAIGYNAKITKNHQIMLGGSSVTEVDTYGDFQSLTNGKGLILLSPSGNKFKLTVSDAGQLTINPA